MDTNKHLHTSKIYGFPVVSNHKDRLLRLLYSRMENEAKKGKTLLVFTPNPEMIVRSTTNSEFLDALQYSDYNIPDGMGMVFVSKLARFLGMLPKDMTIEQRITGADLSWSLVSRLNEVGGRVFLLGATPSSNIKAQLKLSKTFSNLKVSGEPGYINIPFDDLSETERVCRLINKFEPDLLLVALGQVNQELWLTRNRENLNAKIAIGVGGTLDYWSGEKRRVPKIIGDIGLEWFWRLLIEPRRLPRIISAILVFPFVGMRLIFQNRG